MRKHLYSNLSVSDIGVIDCSKPPSAKNNLEVVCDFQNFRVTKLTIFYELQVRAADDDGQHVSVMGLVVDRRGCCPALN